MPLVPTDPQEAAARAQWEDHRDFMAAEDAISVMCASCGEVVEIPIRRIWAMPNADTFDVPAIGAMVRRYLRQSTVSIDPFARNKRWATYTNDLNPDTAAEYHMDAVDFMQELVSRGIRADLIILDPPYSMHQQTVTYGQTKQIALTRVYDLASELVELGGSVLCFGFNSNGLGKGRGFRIEELHLVAHGGHHNDTICMAERKIAHQSVMFP